MDFDPYCEVYCERVNRKVKVIRGHWYIVVMGHDTISKGGTLTLSVYFQGYCKWVTIGDRSESKEVIQE